MKKLTVFFGLFLLMGVLVGCSDLFTPVSSEEGTFLTTSNVTTTQYTIDREVLLSDIYALIYEEVYNDIKGEVLESISEERFDQIYAEILEDLLAEVEAGNIAVTADDIIDMILNIENTSANAVVGITNFNENGVAQSIGSGIIYKHVGDKYYVVTNQHVVEDGTTFEVEFEDGSSLTATLRGVDELVDIAVLYFYSEDEYEVAEFANSDEVVKGDFVLAVGNPIGYDYYGSITMGIISGLDRYFDVDGDGINDMFVPYIQHDAAINSGNSGGALFNIDGEVIGINVIKLSSTDIEGMGFAIPSNLALAVCEDIEELGYSLQKPVLGINFIDILGGETYFTQNEITLPEEITNGFYIVEVYENTSCYGYIEAGDIVTNVAGIEIITAEDFAYNFSQYIVGDVISITVYRDGAYITIDDIELIATEV